MTNPLDVGSPAPDFTLPAADGGQVSLSSHRGRHVVVYFYPKAMTPGCTTEACDFRDSLSALEEAGYAVVGISPDPVETLREFVEQEGLTFRLASDTEKTTLKAWGAYGEKVKNDKTVHGVIRSTVVVGPDGRVELADYGVHPTGHVASLLERLGVR